MKPKTAESEKKAIAKAYVDAQLNTIKKFGKPAKLSQGKYQSIIRHIERATA